MGAPSLERGDGAFLRCGGDTRSDPPDRCTVVVYTREHFLTAVTFLFCPDPNCSLLRSACILLLIVQKELPVIIYLISCKVLLFQSKGRARCPAINALSHRKYLEDSQASVVAWCACVCAAVSLSPNARVHQVYTRV